MELNEKPSGSLSWKRLKISFKAGIKAGVTVMANRPKLDVQDASKLIRGKVGTPITLRIERGAE